MSNSIMPNAMNTGVRRLTTLGGWGLGAVSDIGQSMITEGYNPSTIVELSIAGATDAMLQNLWDNTAAGSQEFAVAANQLLTNLTGGPGGAASAPGYPQQAIPQIQTDFGLMDLSLRSTWDNIASKFAEVSSGLNAIAAQRPNDPTVIQMRTQYNALANQFSSAWSTVFSSASPVHSLGGWEDIATASGIVILGGIAIASGVGIPLVAVVGTILAGLAVIVKWINSQNAQTTVAGKQAQNAAELLKAAIAADAAGNPTLANQYRSLAAGLAPSAGAPQDWNVWLQSNTPWIFGGLLLAVVGMKLLKKL